MLKMHEQNNKDEDPSSRKSPNQFSGSSTIVADQTQLSSDSDLISKSSHVKVTAANGDPNNIFKWIHTLMKGKSDSSLRDAIEEYIEEAANSEDEQTPSVSMHERALLSNILELRDVSVFDVMIPRADIIAVEINTTEKELLSILSEQQHSRLPVYKETMDNIIGTIHIKDILACLARKKNIEIQDLVRDVPIISPAMHVLDLLLMFRQMKKHMALVVDEYGGIDGLVTIGDVIETIVGEIDDEYDVHDDPVVQENEDGSVYVDARLDLDEFEEHFGRIISEDDRDDIETMGGLVYALAGRIPARGEILTHPSGMLFEIVDADLRRVNKILIKNIPSPQTDD